MSDAIQSNCYEFVVLLDVEHGNLNGGNVFRTDADTEIGLVSGECIKRRGRIYVNAQ